MAKVTSDNAKTVGLFQGYYILFPIGLFCIFLSSLYFSPGVNQNKDPLELVLVFLSFFFAGVMLLGYRNRLIMSNRYVRIDRSVLGYTFSKEETPVSDLTVIRVGVRSGASAASSGATDAYYIVLKNRQNHEAFDATDYLPGRKTRKRKNLERVLKSVAGIKEIAGIKTEFSMVVWKDINKFKIER